MAKDPAFLFYPGDWLQGTMHMTFLEKGCYMELLMLQFNRGKFTEAQAKHMLSTSFDVAWATISEKFRCEGGLYWNERLAAEKEKRSRFTESRRNNGKRDKHMDKHMLVDMPPHIEDVNEDENLGREKIRGVGKRKGKPEFVPPTLSEVEAFFSEKGHSKAYAKKAFDHYDLAGWNDTHGNPVKAWKQKMNTNWIGKPEPTNLPNPDKSENGVRVPNRIEYSRSDMGGRSFYATLTEWKDVQGCFPAEVITKIREFYVEN